MTTHQNLKAEWNAAFAALRTAGLEADADDPIAARYRAASDAVNHSNRNREFATTTVANIAGVDTPWNGNAYRVTVIAHVEANSADEAQMLTGQMLAGLPSLQGHAAAPLNGPGSWAPNVKRIERYLTDRDGERVYLCDDGDVVRFDDTTLGIVERNDRTNITTFPELLDDIGMPYSVFGSLAYAMAAATEYRTSDYAK